MNEINFSHDYEKLPRHWRDTEATLLSAERFFLSCLRESCPEFIEQDTRFRDEPGHYPLDFEDAILLILFHKESGYVFTTIRPYTDSKFRFYRNRIFSDFTLKLTDTKLTEYKGGPPKK